MVYPKGWGVTVAQLSSLSLARITPQVHWQQIPPVDFISAKGCSASRGGNGKVTAVKSHVSVGNNCVPAKPPSKPHTLCNRWYICFYFQYDLTNHFLRIQHSGLINMSWITAKVPKAMENPVQLPLDIEIYPPPEFCPKPCDPCKARASLQRASASPGSLPVWGGSSANSWFFCSVVKPKAQQTWYRSAPNPHRSGRVDSQGDSVFSLKAYDEKLSFAIIHCLQHGLKARKMRVQNPSVSHTEESF